MAHITGKEECWGLCSRWRGEEGTHGRGDYAVEAEHSVWPPAAEKLDNITVSKRKKKTYL